jgi:hypothetical protein
MTRYIQFTTADGNTMLVEVEGEEIDPQRGVVKAGLGEKVREGVVKAQATFEGAIMDAVRRNADAFIGKMDELSRPPDVAEISFGLKATGETGNIAIAKAGAEANYSVKLVWKREAN